MISSTLRAISGCDMVPVQVATGETASPGASALKSLPAAQEPQEARLQP